MEWGPAIFHLNSDGTANELFTMKLEGGQYSSVADPIVQIDHMHLDATFSKLFGSTRASESTRATPLPGDEIHIFTVDFLTDGSGKVDATTL